MIEILYIALAFMMMVPFIDYLIDTYFKFRKKLHEARKEEKEDK